MKDHLRKAKKIGNKKSYNNKDHNNNKFKSSKFKKNINSNKKRRQQNQQQIEYQYDDDLIIQDDEQLLGKQNQQRRNQDDMLLHQYESPQDLKIKLAKKLIRQTQNKYSKRDYQKIKGKINNNNQNNNDNFFIMDSNQEQQQQKQKQNTLNKNKQSNQMEIQQSIIKKKRFLQYQQQQQQIQNHLKQSYFKNRNKLYKQITSSEESYFQNINTDDPVIYKGHTQCITSFNITNQHIYSCSKDRSIIKWDRQTGKKDFVSLFDNRKHGKQVNNCHQSDILSLDFCQRFNILATAGQDHLIKLWDTRSLQLISNLKSHRNSVNGVKFGQGNLGNLCSVSSDRTFKQWDLSQRSLMQTFYGHKQQILDIDTINQNDFMTSGNDKSIVLWRTQKQTQIIFEGHDYAIDRIRVINDQKFFTGSQDGSIYLWTQKRKKPLLKMNKAHQNGWICSLDCIKQSNVFASGAIDKKIKIWSIGSNIINKNKSQTKNSPSSQFKLLKQIPVEGIITDIKITNQYLAAAECDEHRLGRWVTAKCKNKIKVYKFGNKNSDKVVQSLQ